MGYCSKKNSRCNRMIKNFKAFKFISRDEYQIYMDKADVIISHAGTGCAVPAIKMGKKVLVFPRRKEYQEHLDNHQLELAEVFSANGYTKTVNNKDELKECLMNLDGFIPKPFIFPPSQNPIYAENGSKFQI